MDFSDLHRNLAEVKSPLQRGGGLSGRYRDKAVVDVNSAWVGICHLIGTGSCGSQRVVGAVLVPPICDWIWQQPATRATGCIGYAAG